MINARYLLLHNGKESHHLIRINKEGPKIYTRAELIKMGYPQYRISGTDEIDTEREKMEANKIYLVFKLFKNNSAEKELLVYKWDKLGDTRPHTENLVKLISRAKKIH